jgi:hypothetical protein
MGSAAAPQVIALLQDPDGRIGYDTLGGRRALPVMPTL